MQQRGDTGTTVIAVVALVLAIAAGVLAWTAYERTGSELDKRIRESVGQRAADSNMTLPNESADMPGPNDSTGTRGSGGQTPMPSTETQTVPQTQP
jgi:hypothetical protein